MVYLAAFEWETGGEPIRVWGYSDVMIRVVSRLTVHYRLRID